MLDEAAKQFSLKVRQGLERAKNYIRLTDQNIEDIMVIVEKNLEDYKLELW